MTTSSPRSLLLDTQAFLWLGTDDPRLPSSLRRELELSNPALYLSLGSVWEIAIKSSLGKLKLHLPLETLIDRLCTDLAIRLLPIEIHHVLGVQALPFHHRDPFDRLLIVQAILEGLPMVSRDTALDAYPIQRIW